MSTFILGMLITSLFHEKIKPIIAAELQGYAVNVSHKNSMRSTMRNTTQFMFHLNCTEASNLLRCIVQIICGEMSTVWKCCYY